MTTVFLEITCNEINKLAMRISNVIHMGLKRIGNCCVNHIQMIIYKNIHANSNNVNISIRRIYKYTHIS